MDFGDPVLLALLLAAALALAVGVRTLRWRARRTGAALRDGGGDVLQHIDVRRDLLRLALVTLALALIAVAAARPQFGNRETEVRQTGIALAVALDVSLSMAAADQPPTRFAVAQREIAALFERLQGDRVGLVIFAGDAFVRFPLTRDIESARQIVAALAPGEGFVTRGTNIAAAIETARDLLADSDAATRAVLVVSDGESFEGDALLAARAAADNGVRVFSAAVGTPDGGTIPVVDPDTRQLTAQLDADTGLPIIARTNFAALDTLAVAGDGRFLRLAAAGDLSSLALDFRALEATTFAVRTESLPVERFQIVAGLALLVLLAEPAVATIGALRRRRSAAALAGLTLLAGAFLAACASQAYTRNAEGNRLYDAGDFAGALETYRSAQDTAPDDRRLNLNAGRALHALGDFEAAVTETGRATAADDPSVAARAFYHIGNHRLAQGDLVGARNAYIEALLRDPADFDAKFNLELVNGILFAPQPPGSMLSPVGPETDQQSNDPTQPGDPQDGQGTPQESDTGAPVDSGEDPGQGSPTEAGSSGAPQPDPGPDGAGDISSTLAAEQERAAAEDRLRQALDELDRDNPTREQALAILDALRQREPRPALSVGNDPPVTIDGDER